MAVNVKFWDRLAKKYERSPVADEAVYQEKLVKTRAYFTPESSVLEFGCGTGSTAIAHAPYVGEYLATDISGNMLEIARKKASGIGNLRFEKYTLAEASPCAAGYDVVLGMSILHLLEDPDAAIAEVFSRLKPGGVFVSSTVCMAKSRFLKLIIPPGRWLGLLPLVRFFSVPSLEARMVAAGFVIEQGWQPTPKSALFLVVRKPA